MSLTEFNKEFKQNEEVKLLNNLIRKNEKSIETLLDRIKYVDVELLDSISEEIKKLKEANEKIEKQIKELTNYSYSEITDKETADLMLHVLDTYFDTFDTLDLNTKRNMIKLLVSSITTDGENITINFLGARDVKKENFPIDEYSK